MIKNNFQPGQRWLIYCDSQLQMEQVQRALAEIGYQSDQYHSSMVGDKGTTLDFFKTIGGVLVAIKCLDEGVDIPTIDHALILASSRNPREFIQRRGRVLRITPNKFFAEIHDVIVLPPADTQEGDNYSYFRSELLRALQFTESAKNKAAYFKLRSLANNYNIDVDELSVEVDFEYDDMEA